ncbi:MAG TPA: M23 family metallopeptidase [Anaeromyxobacter sp.]|nr:M23 family metallopeptidase [Anaeromyxobacter sp.]
MSAQPDDAPRRRRLPAVLAAAGFFALVGLAAAGATGWLGLGRFLPRPAVAPAPPAESTLPPAAGAPVAAPPVGAEPSPVERVRAITVRLARNQTLAQALQKLGVPMAEVNGIVAALTGLFPFNRSRPGDQLRVDRREGEEAVQRVGYRQGPADEWIVERLADGTFRAQKRPVLLSTEVARVELKIEGSLWTSLERAGELPELAVLASDVLAWDVDFYREVRSGDGLRVVVEKQLADGRLLRYGEVLAVDYEGAAVGTKRLFRYDDPAGQTSYYDENGQSARRGFLKSPLKLARITSRYGNRMHPLLGYERAHQGVDYGAPVGTPVWAVGDGTVRQAGWNGQCGKSVTLRHRNGLETVYCHLSSVAVQAGRPVSQKQIIGYVGETGLATGPHLHYAVRKDGSFVNPLTLRIPRDAPVAPQYLDDFRQKVAPLRARLDGQAAALN